MSSPNAEAHSLTSAIAASNSGVMSNFAIDKLLVVREGDAGTNAMVEDVRERQIAATEMMDFMLDRMKMKFSFKIYELCSVQLLANYLAMAKWNNRMAWKLDVKIQDQDGEQRQMVRRILLDSYFAQSGCFLLP